MNVFVFPGQGSQKIGMGKEFFDNFKIAKEVFQNVDDSLSQNLSKLIFDGPLDELTLTTNGSQLEKYAEFLKENGVNRVNVSVDHLDPSKFREITRWGDLDKVLAGIQKAKNVGIKIDEKAIKSLGKLEGKAIISIKGTQLVRVVDERLLKDKAKEFIDPISTFSLNQILLLLLHLG